MSAMDDSGPLDQADDMRSTPQSPPTLTTNDTTSNMLEERHFHPAKRIWNRDGDEAVETSKRARISENLDCRLHDGATTEKLSHDTSAILVLNKDSNGDRSGDHLSQGTNNGALENNAPLVNSTKESGVTESVGAACDASDRSPSTKAMAFQEETSVSPVGTDMSSKESSALNANGEENCMEIDSAETKKTLTNQSSEVGADKTWRSQPDNGNTSDLGAGSPSELPNEKDAQRLTTEDGDLDSKTVTGATNHGQSEKSEDETCVSNKRELSGRDKEDPARTDEETSEDKKMPKTDLKNGDDKPHTSPTGNKSNDPEEAISRKQEQLNAVCVSSKEEDCETADKPPSKTEKEPSRSLSPEEDVIILSDDEAGEIVDGDDASSIDTGPFSPLPDDDPLSKLTEEEMDQRSKAARILQEELRTEEGKLLLLKKLRQSQLQPVQVVQKENDTTSTTNPSGSAVVSQKINPTPNVPTTLPQLLRTSQGTKIQVPTQQQQQHLQQLKQLQQLQQHQKPGSRIIHMPQLIRGPRIQTVGRSVLTTQTGPPPLVMVSRSGTQGQPMQNAQHIIRVSGTGTVNTTTAHIANAQVINQQSRTTSSPANDSQSAASRQAAAKLALRKQLEKTLLQIPPPKPPPPELHFLPSAANNEFIILVGLEEVVNTILELDKDSKRKTAQRFTDPFRCAQCKTDFTTIWKQDTKQGIMCETCIVSNQKKSLKAEHTNRLKTAFVKALQQEQEIEQRMQQGHNPVIHSSQQPSRQLHQISPLQQQQQSSHPIRHRVMNPVPHQQRTVLNPAPNSQRVVQPVAYTYISGMKNSGQAFPYRVPTTQIQMVSKNQISGSHHSAAARQREYLLDMIPSKVLNQNTAVPWKR